VIRNGIKPVLATGCDNETKPALWQECNNHPCHNHWHTQDWSKVSYTIVATYYISLITFSVLLIVGREFKAEMSHAGMPVETRYADTTAKP